MIEVMYSVVERSFMKKSEKEVVFWGAGDTCRQFLNIYPDDKPKFIIDSFIKEKNINGIDIIRPDEISNYNDYYIVIMMINIAVVDNILKNKGLRIGDDYCGFEEFINGSIVNVNYSLTKAKEKKEKLGKIDVVIYASIFYFRNIDMMINFIKYVFASEKRNIVLLSCMGVYSLKLGEEMISGDIIPIPYSQFAECVSEDEFPLLDEEYYQFSGYLPDKEKGDVRRMMRYWSNLIDIIDPSEMLIWGNPSAMDAYCLKRISENRRINYGFLEHGLIPGTILLDPLGPCWLSMYAKNPDYFTSRQISQGEIEHTRKVIEYVKENALDTVVTIKNSDEYDKLSKIDKSKKTVFFAGTMHNRYKEFKPEYWKQTVSEVYTTDIEMLNILTEICKKHDYNLLFKPHPGARDKSIIFRDGEGYIYVEDVAVDELIQIADVVVSPASVVEYKTLINGKPLVQISNSTFNGKNCSYRPKRVSDIENTIEEAIKKGLTDKQIDAAERFFTCLLKEFMWDNNNHNDFRYGREYRNGFFDS